MKKSLFLIGMLISFGSVNGSEAALPRCDAYRKSVQCLTESINRFTDKSFSIMNLLAVRQSADLMSAVSKNGYIKLNFKNPVKIPSGLFQGIQDEISFVAEKNNQSFFEYTSLTWYSPDYKEYYENYYYLVKYAGKSFGFTVKNNIGAVTCDDGSVHTIENLNTANTDCSQYTVNPYLYDLPRFHVDSSSCGMDFWIKENINIEFRSNSFLAVQKPIGEKCI